MALIVALLALAVLLGLAHLLLRAAFGPSRSWLERSRLALKQRNLRDADRLIAKNSVPEACALLRTALYLDERCSSFAFTERIASHNLSILARFVTIGEQRPGRLENLPALESLLSERIELIKVGIEIRATRGKLRSKRAVKRRETPSWALSEFSRKLAEVNEKLIENRRAVDREAERLTTLLHTGGTADVTYH